MIKEIHQLRGAEAPLHLVVNENGLLPKEELSLKEIEKTLNLVPVVSLAFQPDVFARLDTADPDPAVQMIHALTPSIHPLTRAIIGRNASSYTKSNINAAPESPSFLQRLMKRG